MVLKITCFPGKLIYVCHLWVTKMESSDGGGCHAVELQFALYFNA